MSFVFRMFGKVQDTVTRAVYGVEKQTSKMSFYSCVDKMINGDNITVRFENRRIHLNRHANALLSIIL